MIEQEGLGIPENTYLYKSCGHPAIPPVEGILCHEYKVNKYASYTVSGGAVASYPISRTSCAFVHCAYVCDNNRFPPADGASVHHRTVHACEWRPTTTTTTGPRAIAMYGMYFMHPYIARGLALAL